MNERPRFLTWPSFHQLANRVAAKQQSLAGDFANQGMTLAITEGKIEGGNNVRRKTVPCAQVEFSLHPLEHTQNRAATRGVSDNEADVDVARNTLLPSRHAAVTDYAPYVVRPPCKKLLQHVVEVVGLLVEKVAK